MSFLAFPLKLDGPFLRRTTAPQAVLQLLELMARTPAGSWAGVPSFGVRDFFEGMRLRPDGLKEAARAINTSLLELGITHYRLESIVKEPSTKADVDNYILNLVDVSDASRTFSTSFKRS